MIVPERWARGACVTAVGAAFLTAIAMQALAIAQSWGAWYWVPGSLSAVAVCLLALLTLLGRGRSPWPAISGLGVAALAILVTRLADPRELPAEPSPAMALGLAMLVGSALRVLPPVQAGAIAGAGPVVVAAGHLATKPSSGITALTGMIWLAAVGAGLSLRLLDARASATAERARQAERLELARELHDVVAHHITGMVIQAQGAQVVARRNPEQVTEYLSEMEAAGTDALAAMRRVVGLLRDEADVAPASPGPEGLGELVERFRRQGPAVRLNMRDGDWPPEVTSTVYRVVQEALTNVLRHAPKAGSVVVTVEQGPQDVTVEVTDDAPAAPGRPHHRGGYGLIGMRERVETLGGSLRAGPRPDGGWSVRATLPVPTREPR
ncbi:sensor histidine kinase [Actinomadura sp. 6N118]|uniref:sensor histidine kinase n=1 Tax=Actinomadura sp. 6N118 TaxID=3375151 RepID=UPI00378A2308